MKIIRINLHDIITTYDAIFRSKVGWIKKDISVWMKYLRARVYSSYLEYSYPTPSRITEENPREGGRSISRDGGPFHGFP